MISQTIENLDENASLEDEESFAPTRASLLARIRDSGHQEGWRDFFDTYWKLIYNTARKHYLSDTEAQEVVQETMISANKALPHFTYDPVKGSFRAWLMNLVRWKISDQLHLRRNDLPLEDLREEIGQKITNTWDTDWEKNLMDTAIERVKHRVKPKSFQAFAYCVMKDNGPEKTSELLKMSLPRIYLTNHRISKAIRYELWKLKKDRRFMNERHTHAPSPRASFYPLLGGRNESAVRASILAGIRSKMKETGECVFSPPKQAQPQNEEQNLWRQRK